VSNLSQTAIISKMKNLSDLLLKITQSKNAEQLIEQSMAQFKWIVDFDYCQYIYFNKTSHNYCTETVSYGALNNIESVETFFSPELEAELQSLYKKMCFNTDTLTQLPLLSKALNWQDTGVNNAFAVSINTEGSNTSTLVFLSLQKQAFSRDERTLMSIFANLLLLNVFSLRDLREKERTLDKQQEQIEVSKKELAVKAQELALASKYKSEFLANMSHELRTPLNSILVLTKMLITNNENFKDTQIHDLKVIYEGGQNLLLLINDIMDLSKVEAGKLNIHMESILFSDLTQHLQKMFDPLAREKGITFKIELSNELPESLISEKLRLTQILRNLIGNAIKFTGSGFVRLIISPSTPNVCFRNSKLIAKSSIRFDVVDSGIGIAQDKQLAIFESFQQEDGSTTRKYGGTGLGLTISRELTRLLGGEIQLQSILGQGSTFSLFLASDYFAIHPGAHIEAFDVNWQSQQIDGSPVASIVPCSAKNMASCEKEAEIAHTEQVDPHLVDEYQELKAISVLLIDEDMRLAFTLSKDLINIGFDVDICANISEISCMVETCAYGIFIMSCGVSEIEEVCRDIRNRVSCENAVIIGLTNSETSLDEISNTIPELDGWQKKPVQLEQLLVLIEEVYRRRHDS